jgi:hypothetical protein
MKAFRTITVAIVILVLSAATLQAGGNTYGFFSMSRDSEGYTPRWGRVGIIADLPVSGLSAQFDYDLFNNMVKLGYMQYADSLFGGKVTVGFGKMINSFGNLFPGAKANRLPRWADAQALGSCYAVGTGITFTKGPFTIRGNDYSRKSATIGFAGLTAFAEEGLVNGVVYQGSWYRFLNPFVGYANPVHGHETYFIQNCFKLTDNLNFCAQRDWNKRNSWLACASYEFAPFSYLMLSYDTKVEKKIVGTINFAF